MKFVATKSPSALALLTSMWKEQVRVKKQREESRVLGIAAFITLVIVVLQLFFLGHYVPSLTLQAEMMHTASDLLVNVGAWWVAYKAITMSATAAALKERKFMYLGLLFLLAGAGWTTYEAVDQLMNVSTPHLKGEWLIIIGLIDGIGNYIAHRFLDKVPGKDRSHKHELVHLHVKEDLILAGVVILSGLLSKYAGWSGGDPYLSLIVVLWVCKRAYKIFRRVKSGEKLGCC